MKNLKKIPIFKTEDEERDFWATHSALDYFNMEHPVKLNLTHLRRSTRTVTIRMTEALLSDLKILANKKDVPYQSLMKVYLAEKVREERGSL